MLKSAPKDLAILLDLPITPYEEAWRLQQTLVSAKKTNSLTEDILIICEHQPVFTVGNKGGEQHIRVPFTLFRRKGIPVFQTERGGSITFHGPGQLVGYPILDLNRKGLGPVDLVWALEEIMIKACSDLGVSVARLPGMRGVWVDDMKVGSVGIAISKGISYHGFSLNVMLDLEPFSWIDPCGLPGVTVTNLATLAGAEIPMTEIKKLTVKYAKAVLGMEVKALSLDYLHDVLKADIQQRIEPLS